MRLTEAEGKALLAHGGLALPQGHLVHTSADLQKLSSLTFPVFVKAQVLHGNRAHAGLVKKAEHQEELASVTTSLLSQHDADNQPITELLIEEGINLNGDEWYISFTYDTVTRTPVLQYTQAGGTGIEERGEDALTVLPLSIEKGIINFPPEPALLPTLQRLWQVFLTNDATLLEINPIVQGILADGTRTWFCLDAKIELEDIARFRHPEWEQYPERTSLGRPPTKLEERAHKVNEMDHRGIAGESFFEFPDGDVGILTSGGGASILAMDALMTTGLKPANYTEYSGNPSREKVKALTEVVLSIPHLKALWIVGANASFTDIYESLGGVVDGILESPYGQGFPILIRRGGPRWREAFEMVTKRLEPKGFVLQLYGPDYPLVKTASILKAMIAAAEQKPRA